MTSCLHVSVVLDLFYLFYLLSIKNAPQVKFSSAAILYYVNFNLKSHLVNILILFTIFVRLYHAGTVCARRRARLLVCFDRPVG